MKPIDKSKPSNRRCWNCKHFRDARVIEEGPYIESRKFYCETSSNVVRCWSCCPYFEWDPDKQYEQSTLIPPNEPLPVLVNDEPDREYIDYICPRCKNTISQRRRGQRMETVYKCKFHDNCGQRVDWSNPQPYRRPPEGEA